VFFDDLPSLAAVTFLTAAYTQISLEPKNTEDETQVDNILNSNVHVGPYHACVYTIKWLLKRHLVWIQWRTGNTYWIFSIASLSLSRQCSIIPDSSLITISSCYFRNYKGCSSET
jgi:hypothetical protein